MTEVAPEIVVTYLRRKGWTIHMTLPDRWLFIKEPRIVEVPRIQDENYPGRFINMIWALMRDESRPTSLILDEMRGGAAET